MSRKFKKFIAKIFIAAIIMAIIGWGVFTFIVPGHYLPVLPWMLAFFAIVTILTYAYQLYLAKKNMALFTRSSMIISLIRLALYSLFTIIYLASESHNAAVFVVCIMVVYLAFTFIEVNDLSHIAKQKQDRSK